QRRRRKIAALELRVEKMLEHGRSLVAADPALVGIAETQRKPLPARGCLGAGLRRVRRNKRGLRQQPLPGAADVNEILAVGAIAVEKHDQGARRRRLRIEPRSVELNGHLWFSCSVLGSAPDRAA